VGGTLVLWLVRITEAVSVSVEIDLVVSQQVVGVAVAIVVDPIAQFLGTGVHRPLLVIAVVAAVSPARVSDVAAASTNEFVPIDVHEAHGFWFAVLIGVISIA